ncbi:MAG: hypothetical protein JXQ89_20595 [Pelagimonas sp.]
MADKAPITPPEVSEPFSVLLDTLDYPLDLLEAAIKAEQACEGMDRFEAACRDDADEISVYWNNAAIFLRSSAQSEPKNDEERRVVTALKRLATVLSDLDTVEAEPKIWLQTYIMERDIRLGDSSGATQLVDRVMSLMAQYLDLMGVLDIEDFEDLI